MECARCRGASAMRATGTIVSSGWDHRLAKFEPKRRGSGRAPKGLAPAEAAGETTDMASAIPFPSAIEALGVRRVSPLQGGVVWGGTFSQGVAAGLASC